MSEDGEEDGKQENRPIPRTLSWTALPTRADMDAHEDIPLTPAQQFAVKTKICEPQSDEVSKSENVSEDHADEDTGLTRNGDNSFPLSGTPGGSDDADDDANTLVQAALTQDEVKGRHVRFHDHVAESAALVHRMLSTHRPNATPNPIIEDESPISESGDKLKEQPAHEGGSVLSNLIRLHSQHEPSKVRQRRQSRRARDKKAQSMVITSESEPMYDERNLPGKRKPKRPPLVNRPSSWLTNMTSTQYVVPRLDKHKKKGGGGISRRSSMDSTLTTASQFEPISLQDRIRVTFEIANILQKHELLCKLARSLMHYGCPAHRLEDAMRQVSSTLGVDAEYIYMPSVLLASFLDLTTHTTETLVIRQNQKFEMHWLAEIYRLQHLILHGEVSVDKALEFIDTVSKQPQVYPAWYNLFSYALASFSGCIMFFGGRWQDGGISAMLAMFFALYELFSGLIMNLQPIWEVTVCIFIGFFARGVEKYGFCFTPIAFSSFIVILPGYAMSVAFFELVSRQLLSGVVRLVYAIIYSFLLAYGVTMGSALYRTIDTSAPTEQSSICQAATSSSNCFSSVSPWFNFLFVVLFGIAYCVIVRARLPRWPFMIIVASCGYVINYALACWANAPPQVLQVVPAFGLGMVANGITRITRSMSFDAILLGIMYLFPSSVGLKAALGLFGGDDNSIGVQGASFALAMIESSIGITIGLFLAKFVVYPRGASSMPFVNL